MKYYDKIASGYDELYGQEQVEKARSILKYIKPKGTLLDVGAGTGIAAREFEEYCRCIALDPSKKLLKYYNGEKVVGKAERIPFSDGYFDVVISLTVLHHCDIKKALGEIMRVTKENGQIALTIMKKSKVDLKLFENFKRIDIGKDWLLVKKNS